jgi:hypothetical protein
LATVARHVIGSKHTSHREQLENQPREIVETGPDWNTIDKIVITLNRPRPPSRLSTPE